MLASPSNPTGTSIAPDELRRIHEVRAKGGLTIVDEIYLGLSYDEAFGQSALKLGDDIISINSFSKYFNMTGWRLGWMVVPESLVAPIEMLAQHLFICASTISQYAALACFEPESIAEYERRRAEFKARRDYFIPALESVGLPVPVKPDGAFYAWADCAPRPRGSALLREHLQLGLCLRSCGPRPPGHHSRPRLWPGRDGQLCPLFHGQLHGAIAGSHCSHEKLFC